MARKPHETQGLKIERSESTINKSINNKDVLELLTPRGYGLEQLQFGLKLVADAKAKRDAKSPAMGTQKGATDLRNLAAKAAQKSYQDLSDTAKAAFRTDPAKLDKLGLNKPMPRNVDQLVSAGTAMIDNITKDDEIKSHMAQHGYPEEVLVVERAKFTTCKKLEDDQESAYGATQVSTDESQAALKALDDWMLEFKRIAKVALRSRKNLMEKIGIKVRAAKTKAQRAGPKKASATRAAKKLSKGK